MRNTIDKGSVVIRVSDYRKWAYRSDCFYTFGEIPRGTVRATVRDCFGRKCSEVSWSDGHLQLCDNRDLRKIR
jgi:hypothetical protein